jgi:succinoglycan biosynthesis protein ExoV
LDLFHYHISSGNFGDDLNTWLWDEILPGWREVLPGHLLVGVGTLINDKLPRGVPKVVLGSGVGYGSGLPDAALMAECRFVALRGPRSARALGLPPELGIVDPAVLIADLPEFQNIPKSGRPVFVPHHTSVHRVDWARLCDKAGVDYVSPEGEARAVIRKLAAAPLVIAESMHAAILADAFGTPWVGVSVSHVFNGAKWLDWADSLGVVPRIQPLYPMIDALRARLPVSPKALLSGRAPRPAAPAEPSLSGGSAARTHAGPLPLHLKIRIALERPQTVPRLRALSREPGQLSDRARLAAAKARYRAVLVETFGAAALSRAV